MRTRFAGPFLAWWLPFTLLFIIGNAPLIAELLGLRALTR